MIQSSNEQSLSMGLLFICIHYTFICPSLLAVFQKTKEKLFAWVKKKKINITPSFFQRIIMSVHPVSPSESRHVVETGLFICCDTGEGWALKNKKTKHTWWSSFRSTEVLFWLKHSLTCEAAGSLTFHIEIPADPS